MVTGITEKVTIHEYMPQVSQEQQQEQRASAPRVDDSGNPVVVSKEFILNLLSLAIGKPFFMDGSLGNKIDVKV